MDSVTGKKTVKNTNIWRLNSALLNKQEITEEIKEEIKKIHWNKWQWKHKDPKPMGCSKNSSKREVYSNSISAQETRKISNKQSNPTPKATIEEGSQDPALGLRVPVIHTSLRNKHHTQLWDLANI